MTAFIPFVMNTSPNYLLLDAARMQEETEQAKEQNPRYASLYKGRSEEDLAGVAPYLFTYRKGSHFANWYQSNGWGHAWGVLVKSTLPFDEVYKHFRKFLLVKTEDGRELYFRFYDPRVLRTFLPGCDARQLAEFFGPVQHFICEDKDPGNALDFSIQNNALQTAQTAQEAVFSSAKFSF